MTADFYAFEMKFLGETATRIINEVKGVNRVVYDVTSKPPGTVEWSDSRLEAVLAMPPQEVRVGLINGADRWKNAPCLVDHGAHAGDIVHMP